TRGNVIAEDRSFRNDVAPRGSGGRGFVRHAIVAVDGFPAAQQLAVLRPALDRKAFAAELTMPGVERRAAHRLHDGNAGAGRYRAGRARCSARHCGRWANPVSPPVADERPCPAIPRHDRAVVRKAGTVGAVHDLADRKIAGNGGEGYFFAVVDVELAVMSSGAENVE